MEVETSQPEVPQPSGSVAVDAFNKALAEVPAEQRESSAPEPTAPPETPATFAIPLERIPEKFRKNPEAIFEAYQNAEKYMHEKSTESARLAKEAEELRTRLAVVEQVQKMQPQAPPQTSWQKAGINPQEDIIVAPEKVAAHVIDEAKRAAAEEAQKYAQAEAAKLRAEKNQEDQTRALFWALDQAKVKAKEAGYDFSDDEYRQVLQYVGPVVAEEAKQNPNAPFDPNRYVEHIKVLKGNPTKPSLPTEGAPPIAARSATMKSSAPVPTLDKETRDKALQIAKGLGWSKEQTQEYLNNLRIQ